MEAMATSIELAGAIDAEYAALFQELSRLCLALGAGGSADDIAQDVLLEGRAKIAQLRDVARLRPWLRTIAVRRVIRLRARSWRTMGDEPVFVPLDPDLGLDAAAAVARLPLRQRVAVVLVYGLGYHQDEAAAMLGLTRGGVASTLWKARRTLARDLAPYRRNDEP